MANDDKKSSYGCLSIIAIVIIVWSAISLFSNKVDNKKYTTTDTAHPSQTTMNVDTTLKDSSAMMVDNTKKGSGEKEANEYPEKPIVISASHYYRDYEKNQVRADKDYLYNKLQITGYVYSVKKTAQGGNCVLLNVDGEIGFVYLLDVFNDDAIKLVAGGKYTFVGRGGGLLKGQYPIINNAVLYDDL